MKSINDIGLVRVAAVSPKISIADTEYNTVEIIKILDELRSKDVQIAVFPELSISAYTCGDLFLQKLLIDNALNSLIKLKEYSNDKNIIAIVGLPLNHKNQLYNVAAVIHNGSILGIIPKQYLCNYAEYYEKRWFTSASDLKDDSIIIADEFIPFSQNIVFQLNSIKNANFAIEICEDLWAVKPPSLNHATAGANIIFNLSASNEYLGKYQYRKDLIKIHSSKILGAYIYSSASTLESTSDTVFSGNLIIAENGKLLLESERFNFDSQYIFYDIDVDYLNNERVKNKSFVNDSNLSNYYFVSIDQQIVDTVQFIRKVSKTPFIPENIEERNDVCNEITNIQSSALARRLLHINSSKSVIGLSGGLDSTLALLSTIRAFQKINKPVSDIICINMSGFGTTSQTKNNAVDLTKLLGTELIEIDIKPSVEQHFIDINQPNNRYDVTFENAQARMRTLILMDVANQRNGIVIGTGDLSEIALGWSTYNGDQMSMYGLNSGVPKTLIKYLIEWYANVIYTGKVSEILTDILNTPISPELLPTDSEGKIIQETEKTVGPYILNDFFLYHFLRNSYEPYKILEIAKATFNGDYDENEIKFWSINFLNRFFSQQFKRNSNPDGIKVGSISLSQRADFRMPSEASVINWIQDIERK